MLNETELHFTHEANKNNSTQQENIKNMLSGFPGDLVVENPPVNAGDLHLIPGLGRSHMPQSN